MNQTMLPLPNPQDWVDIAEAAHLLGRGRSTVYGLADRGVLTIYRIGASRLLWRPEVAEVARALKRIEAGAQRA